MGLVRSSAFNAKSHLMEIRKLIFIGFCLERLSKTLKEVLSMADGHKLVINMHIL